MSLQLEKVNNDKMLEKIKNMSEKELELIADAIPAHILHATLGKKLNEQTECIKEVYGAFKNRCRLV